MQLAGGDGVVSLQQNRFAMKPNTVMGKVLLIAVLTASACLLRAEGASGGATPPPAADKAVPAVPDEKPDQPKIPGTVIPRQKGGFLGLVVENGNFKLSFYNEKKGPVPIDVARATARWEGHHSIYDERAVLNPTPDGKALISSKFVQPPYVFRLYLTLIPEGENPTVESHTVDFHQ